MVGRVRGGKQEPSEAAAALRLWEEAFHLARKAPAAAVFFYLGGIVPFLLGLLFFWAEMSRGPEAARYAVSGSLGVAVLFFWMKTFQGLAVRVLEDRLHGRDGEPVRAGEAFRLFGRQAALQGTSVFLIPLAAVFLILFPWVYSFYQCVTVFGARRDTDWLEAAKSAARQVMRRPWLNHLGLVFLLPLVLLLFLNVALAIYAAPWLLKVLLGIETVFGTTGWNPLNTTLLAAAGSLVYLAIDFPVKAFYVLQCFYGESLRTGQDLRVEVRRNRSGGDHLSAAALLGLALFLVVPAAARGDSPGADRELRTDPEVAAALDTSLERVMQAREFRWRLGEPEIEDEAASNGWLAGVMERFQDTLASGLRVVGGWAERLVDWLAERVSPRDRTEGAREGIVDWPVLVRIVLWTLLIAMIGVALYAAAAVLRKRSPGVRREASAEDTGAGSELLDDSVLPDERAPDEWEDLARRFLAEGDWRLALRASYLSLLSFLAANEWILPARHKSNSDYLRELTRRAGRGRDLQEAFSENCRLFERCWYGVHEVTEETWQRFQANGRVVREGGDNL